MKDPLGEPEEGTLYYVRGTRVMIYSADWIDIFDVPHHGTGVTSAAVGMEHGTNPDALLVYIPTSSKSGWKWLVAQD